jgi:methionine-gamma-lyase
MRDGHVERIGERRLRPESLVMGYGYRPDLSEGAIKSPIFQTSTFVFRTAEEGKAFFEVATGKRAARPDENVGLVYSRLNNPDLEILEDRLALWEDADRGLVFASGMAAIATTLLSHLRPGDCVLYSSPVYGGTDHVITAILPEFGIVPVEFKAGMTRARIESKIDAVAPGRRLGMVFVETPANPTNDLLDIAMAVDIARSRSTGDHRVVVAVDNTFLGPVFQRPLYHGADLSIYSATKYLGGHSDLIAGAVVGSAEAMAPIAVTRTYFGTMADPWTGWLLMRSLETLHLRMTRQAETAGVVARFLAEHPKVVRPRYLGLLEPGDRDFDLFKRQCLGTGAMVSFEVAGGEPAAFRFLNSLSLIKLAVSLGGTESLAEHPASMTHAGVDPDERAATGVTDGLVRLSIGVEDADDLMADITRALGAV